MGENVRWHDGWTDSNRLPGERDNMAVAGRARFRIPLGTWLSEGLEHGVRISFTLRQKRKNGTYYVDKVLLRP